MLVTLLPLCVLAAAVTVSSAPQQLVNGTWVLDVNSSAPLPLLSTLRLHTQLTAERIDLSFFYGTIPDTVNTSFALDVHVQGWQPLPLVSSRVYVANVFLGLEFDTTFKRSYFIRFFNTTQQSADLHFSERTAILGSQGQVPIEVEHSLMWSTDTLNYTVIYGPAQALSYVLQRQAPAPPSPHGLTADEDEHDRAGALDESIRDQVAEEGDSVFAPQTHGRLLQAGLSGGPPGTTNKYSMTFDDDWSVHTGGLAEKAMLLSLAGVLHKPGRNGTAHPTASLPRGQAELYFVYPEDWSFTYSAELKTFYEKQQGVAFTTLNSVSDALKTFVSRVSGYVVWDPDAPTSLSVALTVAGLTGSVVVSDQGGLLTLVQSLGLKQTEDFRGRFTNQTDAEIIGWSFQQYFDQCNHDYVMWLGGSCGDTRRPAVADFGVMQGAFFAHDLSTKPSDVDEYTLANKIVGSLHPYAVTVGWHSYCKDAEHFFTSLMSKHAARVHGLNTLPNLSFAFNMQLSPGFVFTNHHNTTTPDDISKVFVTCVQSDGLGLGAWNKPGRGEIPYTWEVTLNDLWMQPTLLEMFYRQGTLNDYFVGSLSGPGYMYPKAIPPSRLPHLIQLASQYMEVLDLNGFAMMDESQGTTVNGNMNLPRGVVEAYFTNMPNSVGFVNGYAPSFTFAHNNSRPFLSYDYYLDPARSIADAAADLLLLSEVNVQRPYFLVIHVREFSNILRVRDVLSRLGDEFVHIHSEVLFTLAGKHTTYTTRYEDDPQ